MKIEHMIGLMLILTKEARKLFYFKILVQRFHGFFSNDIVFEDKCAQKNPSTLQTIANRFELNTENILHTFIGKPFLMQ